MDTINEKPWTIKIEAIKSHSAGPSKPDTPVTFPVDEASLSNSVEAERNSQGNLSLPPIEPRSEAKRIREVVESSYEQKRSLLAVLGDPTADQLRNVDLLA